MKKTILTFCCLAALLSCKKQEGPAGPQGPAGPSGPQGPAGSGGNGGTGVITGKVNQYDQYNTPYTTGLNTTTVSIDGTTITTVTDAAGNYSLTNLAAGVYDISYNKSGNGLDKNQQTVFPGTGTLYLNGAVSDKPTYTFANGYVKDTTISSNRYIRTNLNFVANTKTRGGIVFIGANANPDPADPTTYKQIINFQVSANTTVYTLNVSYATNIVNSYPSGTTLYAKVFPYSGGNYFDYANSGTIYTGHGTPLAGTFTLSVP